MRALNSNPNVDNSNLPDYPDGRIRDNDGTGNGTGVNESVYGDIHQTIAKLMRLYAISPNGLPDNESNGFQIIEALSALASKNDYVYPLTTDGTNLNVNVKLSSMNQGEFLICLASANKTTELFIKGIGVATFVVNYSGNFKANEYVRVVRTVSGFSIIRIADWNSLIQMCIDAGFLQKATQAEEDAGTTDTKATTPLVNKVTFTKRVNGADSPTYLATASKNGIYPKEHFATVAGLAASPIKNIGTFTVGDVGGTSGSLVCTGDLISANAVVGSNQVTVTVTMAHTMANTTYLVKSWLESLGTMSNDNDVFSPVFKTISTSQFSLSLHEGISSTQSIKVHVEVVQR